MMQKDFRHLIAILSAVICAVVFTSPAFAAFGFTDSAPLNSDASTDGLASDEKTTVRSDGAGVWLAVWDSTNSLEDTIGTDLDILFARSTDNGATWTANALLNTYGDSDSSIDSRPAIATDGKGNWLCAWHSTYTFENTVGNDFDLVVSHSADNGLTWSPPVVVNSNAASDDGSRDQEPSLASDGNGNWVCVWHSDNVIGTDDRDDYDIRVSRSSDNGATWSEVQNVNSDFATDAAYDQNPRIATDLTGNWLVVWESEYSLGGTIGDDTDILYSRSADNGATWSANAALNSNADTDTGSDYFPVVVTDQSGLWMAVWESAEDLSENGGTDYDIHVATSTNNGNTWSDPKAINHDAATDAVNDVESALATDRKGNWIAVWRRDGEDGAPFGLDSDIVAAKSTNGGQTWTQVDSLNANAAMDSGDDSAADLATDELGNWVAVWRSQDTLGGTIGTDEDSLVARYTLPVPFIEVTKPNGGEQWKIGDKESVSWDFAGPGSGKVTIELLKNGNVVQTIKNKTKNDGKFKWSVPNSVNTGSGYQVRVKLKSNGLVNDESDETFKIKAGN